MSGPLIEPEIRGSDMAPAVKDSSVVFVEGKWHVFLTIKCQGYTAMETCFFVVWERANGAPRTVLRLFDSDYFCAPQVFYFRPHRQWYLIYQVGNTGSEIHAGGLLHHSGER